MCGRYQFTVEEAELRDILRKVEDKVKTGEIYPTNLAPVLLEGLEPAVMTWGFPGFQGNNTIINARSETVLEKKMFSSSVISRRCVIPSSGFFEWRQEAENAMETDSGQMSFTAQPTKPKKTKYLFHVPGGEALYMAGFYNRFKDPKDGVEKDRFVILTTDANQWMKPFHHRMPVILTKNEREAWLQTEDFRPFFDRSNLMLLHQKAG